jgi:aryl-alcohol dehydrogenase-like predicted oxidoreductase
MTFGEEWGWGASKDESKKIFDAYAEAGGNLIDTANRYTEGTSEKFVGEFIHADRDHFVLATKYTLKMRDGDPNMSGNQRKNMMQSLEASLRRLGTDYVDLYWVHAWDFMTPVEEVMRALDDLVRAGKVLYVGISDAPAWVIAQANMLADLRGWTRFVGIQLQYSLVERNIEREHLPLARANDIAVMAWGALGTGLLSGKYNQDAAAQGRLAQWGGAPEWKRKIAQAVTEVAYEIGRTPSQVALNWVRQQPGVVLPILGAKKVEQIKDNLACVEFTLSPEYLARLDEVSKIEYGFPYDFLRSDEIRNIVYSGMFDQIDDHR